MAKSDTTVLYTPDGRKYETTDKAEVTRLRARGYTSQPPKPRQTAPAKTTDK